MAQSYHAKDIVETVDAPFHTVPGLAFQGQ
jgi:hypothetical protein